jgi:hypothetical protein
MQGDPADAVYYIEKGKVQLRGISVAKVALPVSLCT